MNFAHVLKAAAVERADVHKSSPAPKVKRQTSFAKLPQPGAAAYTNGQEGNVAGYPVAPPRQEGIPYPENGMPCAQESH